MKDNEYSRSGREFFPIGQEISGPCHEWNAPPREWSGVPTEAGYSGREYHQDSPPVRKERKKKHRRLQPAMLAAAAVVTAVIAFAPAGTPKYPVQELSAEQRAYLDAVWTAMEASDLDELEVLAREDMARDIVVNVIAPYAHRLAEEYEELGENSSFIREGAVDIDMENIVFQEGGRYLVYYDSEVLCRLTDQPVFLYLSYESAFSESSAQEVYVQYELPDVSSVRSGGSFYTVKEAFLRFSENDGGSSTSQLTWRDYSYNDGEPAGEWILIERRTNDGNRRAETSLQGEFQPEKVYYLSSTGEFRTAYCLHNGAVATTYSSERGSTGGTLDIVDGYTVRWSDTVSIDEYEQIRLRMDDGTLTPLYVYRYTWKAHRNIERVSQNDPLYHQFRADFTSSN